MVSSKSFSEAVCGMYANEGNTITKRNRALKELLSLVAYPVLFCLFLFPPFINCIYCDIGKANMATFMASSVVKL